MNIAYSIKIGIIILFFSNLNSSCVDEGNAKDMNDQNIQEYNEIIKFELNKKLIFPDFTIQHTEHKKIQGPNNAKWVRQTFVFNVFGEDDSQEISWSTGRIRNTKFTVNETEYELVMSWCQSSDSNNKVDKKLDLDELVILKPKKVKLLDQKIQTGDIIFRSTKKKNGEVFFNEYGTIEKTLLGLFVWDLRNTMKQPLNRWSKNGIDNKIAVFRKTSPDFQMNEKELKGGSFNYLFDSEELELVTKNF